MVLASRFDLRDNTGLFGMTLHRRILLSELRQRAVGEAAYTLV
jgi:hypothetical protein